MTQFLGLAASIGSTSSTVEGAGGLFARSTVNGQGNLSNGDGGEGVNFSQFLEGETTPEGLRPSNSSTSVSQIALQSGNEALINVATPNLSDVLPDVLTENNGVAGNLETLAVEGENPLRQAFASQDEDIQFPAVAPDEAANLSALDNSSDSPPLLPNTEAFSQTGTVEAESLPSRNIILTSFPDPTGEIYQRLQAEGVPVQQQENAVLLPLEVGTATIDTNNNDLFVNGESEADFTDVLSFPPEFQGQILNVLGSVSEFVEDPEILEAFNTLRENIFIPSQENEITSLSNAVSESDVRSRLPLLEDAIETLNASLTNEEREAFFNTFSDEFSIGEEPLVFSENDIESDNDISSQQVISNPELNLNPNLSSPPSPVGESEASGTERPLPDPLLTVPASSVEELLDGEEITVNTSQQELGDDLSQVLSRNDEEAFENSLETESLVVLPLVGAVNVSQRTGFETLVEAPQNLAVSENLVEVPSSELPEVSIPEPQLEVDGDVETTNQTIGFNNRLDDLAASAIDGNKRLQQPLNTETLDDVQVNEIVESALGEDVPVALALAESGVASERVLEAASRTPSNNRADIPVPPTTPISPSPEGNTVDTTLERGSDNRLVEQNGLTQANSANTSPAIQNVSEGVGAGQTANLENLAAASLRPSSGRSNETVPSPVNNGVNVLQSQPTEPLANNLAGQQGNNSANQQLANQFSNQFTGDNEAGNRLNALSGETGNANNTAQPATQSLTQADAFAGARQISQILAQPIDGAPLTQVTPQIQLTQQPATLANFQPQAQFSSSQLPNETLPTLSAQISRNVSGGQNSFTIQLNPSELGRVDVRLVSGDDGTLTARIQVEQAETLDLFQRDVRGLERALQQSGLRLSEAGIDLSLRDNGSQNNNAGQGQQNASGDARGNDNSQNGRENQQNPNDNNPTLSDRLLVDDVVPDVPDSLVRTLYAGFSSGQLNIEV